MTGLQKIARIKLARPEDAGVGFGMPPEARAAGVKSAGNFIKGIPGYLANYAKAFEPAAEAYGNRMSGTPAYDNYTNFAKLPQPKGFWDRTMHNLALSQMANAAGQAGALPALGEYVKALPIQNALPLYLTPGVFPATQVDNAVANVQRGNLPGAGLDLSLAVGPGLVGKGMGAASKYLIELNASRKFVSPGGRAALDLPAPTIELGKYIDRPGTALQRKEMANLTRALAVKRINQAGTGTAGTANTIGNYGTVGALLAAQGNNEYNFEQAQEQKALAQVMQQLAKQEAGTRTLGMSVDDAIPPFNPLRITEATQSLAPGSLTQPTPKEEPGFGSKVVPWLNQNKGKVLAGAGGLALLTYLLSRRRRKNDEEELARRRRLGV
jgi:hypothetical protein